MSLQEQAKKKAEEARKKFLSDAPKKPDTPAVKNTGGSTGGSTHHSGKSSNGSQSGFDMSELDAVFGRSGAGSGTDRSKTGGSASSGSDSFEWKDYSDEGGSGGTGTYGGASGGTSGGASTSTTATHTGAVSVPGDTMGYGGFTSGTKSSGTAAPVDPYAAGMTSTDTAGVGVAVDEEEMEEARNRAAWMNPDNGDYLAGYAATDPKIMDERQIRSGFRRWMHSFISGVPFSRHRSGTRFLLRKDELEPWEINVIIYGDLFGGYVNRGARLKVRGRRDNASGDLIAEEIITDAGPLSGSVTSRGLMSAGTVRLLTLVIAVALVFVLYGGVLLLFGAANAVAAFFRMLIQFIKVNWVWMVLLVVGFNWIRQRMRRWFRF